MLPAVPDAHSSPLLHPPDTQICRALRPLMAFGGGQRTTFVLKSHTPHPLQRPLLCYGNNTLTPTPHTPHPTPPAHPPVQGLQHPDATGDNPQH